MAVQPTYPGVYVQEVLSGVRTITGVSTSVTAFVGPSKRGPINKATLIFSFASFERVFGGIDKESEMTYAVRQFFLNGGTQAIIIRLANNAVAAGTILKNASVPANVIQVTALDKGFAGNNITLAVVHNLDSTGTAVSFNFDVRYTSTENPADNLAESFGPVVMDEAATNFIITKVNDVSRLVKVTKLTALGDLTLPDEVPARAELLSGNFTLGSAISGTSRRFMISLDGDSPTEVVLDDTQPHGTKALVADLIQKTVRDLKPAFSSYAKFTCTSAAGKLTLSPGSRGSRSSIVISAAATEDASGNLELKEADGAVLTNNPADVPLAAGAEGATFTSAQAFNLYIGSQLNREGIYALESADIFNILCLPGVTDINILSAADAYCKSRRAFMIIDAPKDAKTPAQMATAVTGTALPKSDYAAVYYPWIYTADPLNNGEPRLSAPCGTMAGLYARIDSNRGVWKAAAGIEASLTGVSKLDYPLTDNENGLLNPLAANCLRVFSAYGPVSWGARTLNGNDQIASEWKYIPVRRTALYIEESLYRGLKWVVFEPNDEPLWAQIRMNVGAFMHNLFRQGAFQGQKKSDAYFVKCDAETTTQNDINLGIVNIWVGFAPLKPAEFVILYLQQMAGQIQV